MWSAGIVTYTGTPAVVVDMPPILVRLVTVIFTVVVAMAPLGASMSSVYISNVQLGALPSAGTMYVMDVQLGTRPTGSETDSGALDVTSEAGSTVSGLTIGKYYSIQATGGPWDNGLGDDTYAFSVSNDGGSTWSGEMGWADFHGEFRTDNPAWSTGLVNLDGLRARMHWQATTTSIKIRVADSPDKFGDNSGSLGWSLREGLGIFTYGVRLN